MNSFNSIRIKRMVGIALLSAIAFVLQFFVAGALPKLPINGGTAINLALIPVVVGAILYGPIGGLIVGLFLGATTLLPGQGAEGFMVNWYMTIFTIFLCLAKTGVAGFVAGILFKVLSKRNYIVAIFASAIVTPIINTGMFVLLYGVFMYIIAGENYGASFVLIVGAVGVAFLVELLINIVLSPAIATIVRITTKRFDLGFTESAKKVADLEENKREELVTE